MAALARLLNIRCLVRDSLLTFGMPDRGRVKHCKRSDRLHQGASGLPDATGYAPSPAVDGAGDDSQVPERSSRVAQPPELYHMQPLILNDLLCTDFDKKIELQVPLFALLICCRGM